MQNLHDPNLNNFRKITGYVLSILATAMLVFSGVMKLIGGEFMVDAMGELHLLPAMQFIGILEIAIVALYWIPRTMKLGFLLACSYVGGIIAAELIGLEGKGLPIPGVPLAIMLYVGTFLRKKDYSGLNI